MKLGVISDIHGNLLALREVLRHLKRQGVDHLVNLGDSVSAPLWPRETLELLGEHAIPGVRGNHDRWLGDSKKIEESKTVAFTVQSLTAAECQALIGQPARLQIDESVLAVHGTPASDVEYLLEDNTDERLHLATTEAIEQRLGGCSSSLILCGHSHSQRTAFATSARMIVNPGAVGCPRYADNEKPSLNEAGSPHARYAVVTRTNNLWAAELFVLSYDWHTVAARAQAMGRPDWAAAFLRGA